MAVDILLDDFGLMNRVTVDHDVNWPSCANHQTFQKLLENLRSPVAFVNHESKITAWADRRNHVKREATPGHRHHWRLADRRPRCASVVVRPDARLSAK
jgi:hypothetical protein